MEVSSYGGKTVNGFKVAGRKGKSNLFLIAAVLLCVCFIGLIVVGGYFYLDKTGGNSTLVKGNVSCGVILFYGSGCPHCSAFEPKVVQAETELGCFIDRKEIYENASNHDLFLSYEANINASCGFSGVPSLYNPSTKKALCGNREYSELINFMKGEAVLDSSVYVVDGSNIILQKGGNVTVIE